MPAVEEAVRPSDVPSTPADAQPGMYEGFMTPDIEGLHTQIDSKLAMHIQ